jgi:hypothetical protein
MLTIEPTIYHTRGEHANHYTTDAVQDTQMQSCEIKHYSWRGVLDTALCDKVCQ